MNENQKLTMQEIVQLLLYLCDDLKMKVFNKEKFEYFQLPVLNSIMNAIKEQEHIIPMSDRDFNKIVVQTDPHQLVW